MDKPAEERRCSALIDLLAEKAELYRGDYDALRANGFTQDEFLRQFRALTDSYAVLTQPVREELDKLLRG